MHALRLDTWRPGILCECAQLSLESVRVYNHLGLLLCEKERAVKDLPRSAALEADQDENAGFPPSGSLPGSGSGAKSHGHSWVWRRAGTKAPDSIALTHSQISSLPSTPPPCPLHA